MKNIGHRRLLQSLFCIGLLASLAVGLTLPQNPGHRNQSGFPSGRVRSANGDVFNVEATTCAPSPAGLVSWYRAEANGNDQQSVNNASLKNGVTFGTGRVGQAFRLDGVNDTVIIPDSASLSITSELTIEAWVKPASISGTKTILSKYNTPNSGLSYWFGMQDGGLQLAVYGSGSGEPHRLIDTTTTTLSTVEFTHVAGTFNSAGQLMKIYVNGVDVPTTLDLTSANVPSLFDSITPVRVGSADNNGGDLFFSGLIDEPAIYNRALSAAEIQRIFAASSQGKCLSCTLVPANSISWYRAENNGNDSIGPNNGTLQNGAGFASGKVGQALSLDASNNAGLLVSSSSSLNPTEAITLEAWVNPSSYPNTAPTVLRKDVNTVGTTQYSLLIGDGVTAGVAHCNIGGFAAPVGGSVPLNQWTHVACTYDRQNVRLYVNGIQVASSAVTQSIPGSTQALGIGIEPGFTDRNFDGLIDEVTIYDRALSSSEIQTLFNADSAGKCATAGMLQAVLNVTPSTVGCGQPVQFDGSSSTAASGRQIFVYQWNFDDGSSPITTFEPTIQHTYSSFGVYHPTLIVQDNQGDLSSAAEATVRNVDNNAPIATIQAPTSITHGQVVNFDGSQSSDPDSACGGHVVSWRWRVDAGGPIETSSPIVSSSSFAAQLSPGTHSLTLVVFDDSGNQSAATTQSLTVGSSPVATLTVNPSTVGCGQPVSFDGSRSSAMPGRQIVLYRWNFGDGTGMLETNQSTTQHTYQPFGVYHPTLTVVDSEGDTSTATQATVRNVDNNIPTAVIQAPSTIANGQSVTFDGSQSTDPDGNCGGRVVEWRWRIDSGNPVQLTTATVSSTLFAAQLTPGNHSLTLIVVDEAGNESAPATHQLVIQGGTLELMIDVEPDSDVPFTLTGPPAIGSILLDGSPVTELPATKTLNLPAGTYSVVQQQVKGFGLVQLNCSDPDNQSTVNLSTGTATIKLQIGETVRCTFTSIDVSTPQTAAAALKTLHYSEVDAASTLKQLGFTATQVAAALQNQFALSAERIAQCLKIAEYSAMEIGVALKVALGRSALEVAISLKALEYDATVIAAVAAGAFALTAAPVAAILKAALFTSVAIGAALAKSLDQTPLQVAVILKTLEYSATEIAAVIEVTFTVAVVEVAQVLILAEIPLLEVSHALKDGLNQSAAQIAVVLKTLQFTEAQVAAALKDTFNLTAAQIAQLLKDAQFTEAQIASALKNALNQSATQIAVILRNVLTQSAVQTALILKNLQYTATEIAVATQVAFSLTGAQVTQVLKAAQFGATAIAIALNVGLNQTAIQTAVLLKDVEFGATVVAIAVRDAFNLTPAQVVQILKNAQFTAAQIAEAMKDALNQNATQIAFALKDVLNQTAAQVTTILKNLHYSETEVAIALRDAFNMNAAGVAQTLKDALFPAQQIATALKIAFNLGAAEVATILKSLQFSATVTATAISAAFALTAVETAQALAVAQYTSTQITLALKDGLGQNAAQAAAILKLIGFDVTTIATRLAQQYGLLAAQVASILKELQYSATEVATALNSAFTLTAVQIAQTLKDVQYSSTQITLALKNALNRTAQQTAQILKQLNYSVSTISNRLAEQFGLTASQVGTILHDLQYTATEVSQGLNSAFNISASQIAQILKSLNYTSTEISLALKNALDQSPAQAAQILQQLNYSIATISARLNDVFHTTAANAAQILYDLDATSTEIATALKTDFGRSAKQTAQLLADLGYSATNIAKRLDDIFGKSASAAAGILKDVGFGAITIATAMKNAFNKSATQTVVILKDLGYSINTLVRVLDEVFNKGVSSIQSILLDLGYSLTDVLDAIREVLGV